MASKTYKVYDNNNKAVLNAYEMLMANISINDSKEKIKTIALTSCGPKEGKTSLAIGLATTMARSGWKVLLIDADMRKPNAAKRLNDSSVNGLSDYIARNMDLNDILTDTNILNLTYLSCGNDSLNPVYVLKSDRFNELIEKVRKEYDFVLLDTPALESVIDGAIVASKVDAALLIARMGHTSISNIKRFLEVLSSFNVNLLGVVLNKVKKRDYKKYFKAYNYFFDSSKFINKRNNVNALQSNSNVKNI